MMRLLAAPKQPVLLAPVAGGMPQLDVIHHCDALTLLRALPDRSIDMAITSPPYDNLRRYNGYSWNFDSIAVELYRVLKPGSVLVWVVGDSVVDGSETLTSFEQALYFKKQAGFNMHDTMIWRKVIPGIMGKRYNHAFEYMFVLSKGIVEVFNGQVKKNITGGKATNKGHSTPDGWKRNEKATFTHEYGLLDNVWDIPSGSGSAHTGHPAVFPELLAKRHILTWTNPGATVLDCFMGSGTTAKVARQLNRRFIGCDISAEYVELARRRLAQPYQLDMMYHAGIA